MDSTDDLIVVGGRKVCSADQKSFIEHHRLAGTLTTAEILIKGKVGFKILIVCPTHPLSPSRRRGKSACGIRIIPSKPFLPLPVFQIEVKVTGNLPQ
ncbi:MAG: hypothetical protein K1X85_07440 [Ignavibacteria bacterium]|nr:hypothetical protein [Ignavibacteria bacterium]